MKICVYLAFLIARLQISKFNKKLYRQSKLLPVANKFNKIRHTPSLNDCAFSLLLTFLVSVGFFPVSFDSGDGSSQLVSARIILFT